MRAHLLNLVLYSVAVSVLLSVFMREGTRERLRFAAIVIAWMVCVSIAVGWLMYLVG